MAEVVLRPPIAQIGRFVIHTFITGTKAIAEGVLRLPIAIPWISS